MKTTTICLALAAALFVAAPAAADYRSSTHGVAVGVAGQHRGGHSNYDNGATRGHIGHDKARPEATQVIKTKHRPRANAPAKPK